MAFYRWGRLDLMRKIENTARQEQLVSLPQTKSKKPEIAAPQAVCDVVCVGPPELITLASCHYCLFSSLILALRSSSVISSQRLLRSGIRSHSSVPALGP